MKDIQQFQSENLLKKYRRKTMKHQLIRDLTNCRLTFGISRIEVAKKMKTTSSAIARLEMGNGQNDHSPTLKTIEAYAKAIDVKIIYKIEVSKNA